MIKQSPDFDTLDDIPLYFPHMVISPLGPVHLLQLEHRTPLDQLEHSLLQLASYYLSSYLPPVLTVDFSPHHLHLHKLLLQQSLDSHQFASQFLLLLLPVLKYQLLVLPDNRINYAVDLFSYLLEVFSNRPQ